MGLIEHVASYYKESNIRYWYKCLRKFTESGKRLFVHQYAADGGGAGQVKFEVTLTYYPQSEHAWVTPLTVPWPAILQGSSSSIAQAVVPYRAQQ